LSATEVLLAHLELVAAGLEKELKVEMEMILHLIV
tara:strand:+ start:168 stop:272 length:105 start_codon:yes stop_codon:yes gene_type:complete